MSFQVAEAQAVEIAHLAPEVDSFQMPEHVPCAFQNRRDGALKAFQGQEQSRKGASEAARERERIGTKGRDEK